MRRHTIHLLSLAVPVLLLAGGAVSATTPSSADRALSDDPVVAAPAIESLRARGQAGVDTLMAVLRDHEPGDPKRTRLERVIDQVCAQKDCASSGLFWHTDLDAARIDARRTRRPILSLRLLGRLDEDRSCANSRYFRTVLYPDPDVARLLRQRFVLHWSSERPVPQLHIDMGDGRSIEGTITGNSVHHVLDDRGRVIDALPGLYGAGLFRDRLNEIATLADRLRPLSDARFADARGHDHRQRLERNLVELSALLGEAVDRTGADRLASDDGDAPSAPPTAREAARRAQTKSLSFDAPVLDAVSLSGGSLFISATVADAAWGRAAARIPEAWKLSQASRAFLLRKHGAADAASEGRVLASFEAALAVDTVRNEYQLHAEIHRWLGDAADAGPSFEDFNARVYSELFASPASDPWLGLRSPDTYLALDAVVEGRAAADPAVARKR